MAIDTSIYNNVRPFTMGDPFETAGKVLALRDAQRKFTLQDDIAAAGAASGGDPEQMAQALLAKGHYEPALKLRSQAATLAKEQRLARNADIEHKLRITEAVASDAIALDTVYRQALQRSGGNPQAAMAAVQPVYMQIRQKWSGMGQELPEQFDPQANFASIGQAQEALQYLKTLAPEVKMVDVGWQIVPTNVNPNAGTVGPVEGAAPILKTAAPATPTELARLQQEREAIRAQNPNDPRLVEYDRVLANYKAGGGDVNLEVNTGPMTPGKPGQKSVDDDLLAHTRSLMQLEQIKSEFRPEYQRIGDRAKFVALAAKDKTVGLTNKERQDLQEFSAYKRKSFNMLNEYIKAITGAALSVAEANRIMRAMPNPGEGIFDGDSPAEYEAKLTDVMKDLRMAVARGAYIKRNGMSLEDGQGNPVVPLSRMPQLINERGQEIERELKASQPGVSDTALQRAVRRQLAVEFGLVSD